ncbi:MAG TPA: outer membrane beta-barrel protein [Verrucomicrobiota bacterium]|nr:outer membrane beta-barrel protein [Verrucomicrobiota bacterium]
MNKIVASFGVAALGASSIQAVSAQNLTGPSRLWDASLTLRAIYDDNRFALRDSDPAKDDGKGFGFQISPSVGLNWAGPATTVRLGYTYSFKWYESTLDSATIDEDEHDDQTHTFTAALNHAFNDRYSIALSESFVVGQEPDTLRDPDGPLFSGPPFRVPGDNIRNYASVAFNAEVTPLLGVTLAYNNSYYNYDADLLSDILDRMEHTATVMGRWHLQPETTGLFGYTFRYADFLEDPGTQRDRRSHIVFVGAEHSFRPDLRGSAKVGIEFAEYPDLEEGSESEVSPYADANLLFMYLPESYAQVGVTHQRSATDVIGNVNIVRDSETTVLYAKVRHMLAPRLFADVSGTLQHSEFSGGQFDGDNETFYLVGLQLEYQINPYLAAHVGYNYDNLCSDIPFRGYDRNRVYIGMRASY